MGRISPLFAVLFATGATVWPALAQKPARASGSFAVAVVRDDAFLYPVATWREGAWHPLAEENLTLTSDGRQLAHDSWTFHPTGAGSSRALTLKDQIISESHCEEAEGYATDAPRVATRNDAWPRTKAGVAVQGAGQFARAENVIGQRDSESRRVAALIVRHVHVLDAEAVRENPSGRLGRVSESVRANGVVRLLQFARARTTSGVQYYFEARTQYRGVADHRFVTGWVTQAGSDVPRLSGVRSWPAGYSGEKTLVSSTVLGLIRMPDRVVWLLEDHGYENEEYALVDLGAGGRVLTVHGGGC